MRIAHLCTRERSGGAARAANRLHAGLRAAGHDSHMVVHRATTDDPSVHSPESLPARLLSSLCMRLDKLPLRLYLDRDRAPYNPAWMPGMAFRPVRRLEPDVVHLHWIGGGFVGLGFLAALECPVVWTLHDMWAFTGGCHYSAGCGRYRERCGACPRLDSQRERDLSRWTWHRKARALRRMDLTVVTPSRWMASRAAESSLLGERRIEVVPNGLDLDTYRPLDRQECRAALDLPSDACLIAFGGVKPEKDPRKGGDLLREALERLADLTSATRFELVVFGARARAHESAFPFPVHRLGYLEDDRSIVRAYSAADLFVIPSREDNLPNTVAEALACGTPVVGWEVGGIPEMVASGESGYLVPPGRTDGLAGAIARMVAETEERRMAMSRAARRRAEARFSMEQQAVHYAELYRDLLA